MNYISYHSYLVKFILTIKEFDKSILLLYSITVLRLTRIQKTLIYIKIEKIRTLSTISKF